MSIKNPSYSKAEEPLSSPASLLEEYPLTPSLHHFVAESRSSIRKILRGTDPRMLIIVGPCSIHDPLSAKEYATRLKRLSQQVEDTFLLSMRVYFEKPRTSLGWKGFLYDPFLDGSYDMEVGLRWTRELLLEILEIGIPPACEFLDPHSPRYFDDLICWGCIGARSAESQIHRQMASGLSMPVGIKNNTDGNVDVAIQGALVAQVPQHYLGINEEGQLIKIHSEGNPDTHLVLRGGQVKPNYDPRSLLEICDKLEKTSLIPALMIDCSHGNSQRNPLQQPTVFQSAINQKLEGNRLIRGLLVESHIHRGKQVHSSDPSDLMYGVSITDPCLDWETTEQMIHWAYDKIQREVSIPQKYPCSLNVTSCH